MSNGKQHNVTQEYLNQMRRHIPDGWDVVVMNVKGIRARLSGMFVCLYELRAYDPREPHGELMRKRSSGYNPIVLDRVTSGHGVPMWMSSACRLLRKR